jgi:hypothetical protein
MHSEDTFLKLIPGFKVYLHFYLRSLTKHCIFTVKINYFHKDITHEYFQLMLMNFLILTRHMEFMCSKIKMTDCIQM